MHSDIAYLLKNLNLKATPKRIALLEILKKESTYLSPEEIWHKMKKRFARVGLPTIYRILGEFSEGGVISKITHPNRQLYYYYCKNSHHHHHFICLSCRNVSDIDLCILKDLEKEVAENLEGKMLSHIMQVNGLCKGCLKGSEES